MTIEKARQILSEGCKLRCKEEHEGHNFQHIIHFCSIYKISHYCFDIKNKLVSKNLFASSAYSVFVAYIINDHLYTVRDQVIRQRIMKQNANTTASALQNDTEVEIKDNNQKLFNVEKNELEELKDSNVYLDQDCLKDLLKELFLEKKVQIRMPSMMAKSQESD